MTSRAIMSRFASGAAVVALAAFSPRTVEAQISVSGSPAQMTVSAAIAGSAPIAVSNALTTYTISKPGSGSWTITAQLNSPMPAGVTLTVDLAVSGAAVSAGVVTLTTAPANVVTGIRAKINGRSITYVLSATSAAGVVPVQTRIVTLTAVAAP